MFLAHIVTVKNVSAITNDSTADELSCSIACMVVKICGIRRLEDMRLAADAGADSIGLLVGQRHTSGDFIAEATAKRIVEACPPSVVPVLVTHVDDPDAVHAMAAAIGVTTIQVHSEMAPEGLARLRTAGGGVYRLLKSYHVVSAESVEYGEAYRKFADGFVLDSVNPATGQVGGTGLAHDWRLSRAIVERYPDVPVMLAGGLHPDNVAAAVAAVRPYGVDVNSGTKGPDGFKDPERVRAFVRRAKSA